MAAREEPAAGVPLVAIVGRPNVGKSTLFNRLVRARRAIVDDVPGVTRDRIVAPAEHAGRQFLCVDTGGFATEAPRDPSTLAARVREQTLRAVTEADCVVCVFDAAAGLLPEERDLVRLLGRSGKPVAFVVNKVDTPARERLLADFYAAGVDRLLAVSAAHARGLEALRDAIVGMLPPPGAAAAGTPGTRLAIVGRPNVGKSSLLNRLLGDERAIVTAEPGTTRDAIDTSLTVEGRPYVLIDTAGIRRRARTREALERHGAVRAIGTLARADLALVVLDAAEGMTDQDARIVARAREAGRGAILLANKWDAVPAERRDATTFRRALADLRPAFADLPLLCVSARTGEGLGELFPLVARVERAYDTVLPTAELNRALQAAVEAQAPPSVGGRPVRLFYATQTGRRPPEVTVFASAPEGVPTSYARYLAARLARTFGLVGVPLRLVFRARPRGGGPRSSRKRRAVSK
ncbi:MAG: ribosome biogenesis GTPase Der [Deltaproteobacteria bacterium]|nr:MAG: ribosome biogenesis GTPase Der [Deltaproteobacteria bacterium]